MAASAVLIVTIGCVIIGLILLGPKVYGWLAMNRI